ncbi:hypothetical protein DEV91_102389 [Phyllobacterium brassicacearum]|nr:hypothetical protein DEV91_102389 [Phyllobacterium brassicacearum]
MTDEAQREPARNPQDLERLLIARQWIGDVDGMAALFEPNAEQRRGAIDGRERSNPRLVRGYHCNGAKNLQPESRVRLLSVATWR